MGGWAPRRPTSTVHRQGPSWHPAQPWARARGARRRSTGRPAAWPRPAQTAQALTGELPGTIPSPSIPQPDPATTDKRILHYLRSGAAIATLQCAPRRSGAALVHRAGGAFESAEEARKRELVLGELEQVAVSCFEEAATRKVRSTLGHGAVGARPAPHRRLASRQGVPSVHTKNAGVRIYPFGSYRLGVHSPGADIDVFVEPGTGAAAAAFEGPSPRTHLPLIVRLQAVHSAPRGDPR